MPEITVIHIALLGFAILIGIVIGWVSRSGRCAKEKTAINIGWQEQISAQRTEHDRLGSQNKSLMEQVNQYQASNTDAKMRAKELSDALKETFERRDELQRQIKDIRSNLEATVAQRNQLQDDIKSHSGQSDALRQKDEKIAKLRRELDGWQERLPPLIERFRTRNEEALKLEADLAEARIRIHALETMVGSDQTRVEPVNPDAMREGMDASNDSLDEPQVEPACAVEDLVQDDWASQQDVEDDRLVTETAQATSTSELLDDLDDLAKEIADGAAATSTASPETVDHFAETDNARRDNLKRIKGIGPAIEKTLNELGMSRFEQIAEMSEYDIDRIAKRLKGFHSRIYREDWIGQARELHRQNSEHRQDANDSAD